MPPPAGLRGVLLDIEGTLTPLAFVRDVLFPYAQRRLEVWSARAGADAEIAAAVALLRAEQQAEGVPGEVALYARELMAIDRKSPGLKALQGLIWREGYLAGELRAPLFDDVPPALRSWAAAGIAVRIFSSGSVLAQRLLFAHTGDGDLTRWIAGYHDTTTGPKTTPEAYRRIAGAFGVPPAAILFLSDVEAELDAARSAGLGTGLVARPGNPPVASPSHPVYADFGALA